MPSGVYKRTLEHKEKIRQTVIKRHQEGEIGFSKGNVPWNKDKKLHYNVWNKGIKRTDIAGDKHPRWMGDNVGYQGVHQWLRKVLGKPSICWDCKTIKAKKYEWANISKQYKRDLKDWKRLCVSCHRKYDSSAQKMWITRRSYA